MLIIVPVLLFIGWMMKSTPKVSDWVIPYILTTIGIVAGIAITKHIVEGAIQGLRGIVCNNMINLYYTNGIV